MPFGRLMRGLTAATETATHRAKPQLSPSHGCYTQSLTLYEIHSIPPSMHACIATCQILKTSFTGINMLKCWPPTQLCVVEETLSKDS